MWQLTGQDESISLLVGAIKKGSLSHAYLFTGPEHSGKMTLAVELAKAVNCEAQDVPCGECNSCERIAGGKHADIRIVNLSSDVPPGEKPRMEIGIDVIRDIQKQVSLPPYEGKYRVFIIEGAESLSEEAANCLLKTLEEPLGRVLFLLLTVDEKLLPATVVSRCQRLKVRCVARDEIESLMTSRFAVAPEQANLIARLSHGAVGWAVTAAEDEIFLEEFTESAGKALSLLSSGYDERFSYAASLALQFAKRNGLVEEFLDTLIDLWHDILLLKLGDGELVTNINFLPELSEAANNLTLAEVRTFIHDIQEARRQLELNGSPRLVLEVLMLNMPRTERVLPRHVDPI